MGEILVVGSLAYDSIKSPEGTVEKTLGGAANFFSLAAHHAAPVRVVGVVGDDYQAADLDVLRACGNVDVEGVQKVGGKTFYWSGVYEGDLSEAITLQTDLNVFADFDPQIPASYKNSSHVFLANIDPELQLSVLNQVERPLLTAADTMNFWIHSKREALDELISKIDLLFINEGEAKLLTGKQNAIAASEALVKQNGLKAVVVKRGEYGSLLRSGDDIALLPAFPVPRVFDPTGAGDSFAGAFYGHLCKTGRSDFDALKAACVHGTVMASFTVESFGLSSLLAVDAQKIAQRTRRFLDVVAFSNVTV